MRDSRGSRRAVVGREKSAWGSAPCSSRTVRFKLGAWLQHNRGGRRPTPVVAVAWSLLLFGDHARLGLFLIGEVAGGVLIVMAVVLLARSPYLEGRAGSHEDAAPAAGSPEP